MEAKTVSEFVGKVVLITGAASGMGSATAVEFARQGATLSLIDKNNQDETIEKCKTELRNRTVENTILTATGDITKDDICNKFVAETLAKFGKIDILINCAGILTQDNIFSPNLDTFDKTISINLRAMYNLCAICTPHLIKTKGNIVNFSSIVSEFIAPSYLSYCISKAGVSMLTRHTAAVLQTHGVRCNSVRPGAISTPLLPPDSLLTLSNIGKPQEIVNVVLFLASSKASFMTGSNVLCDGGMSTPNYSKTGKPQEVSNVMFLASLKASSSHETGSNVLYDGGMTAVNH